MEGPTKPHAPVTKIRVMASTFTRNSMWEVFFAGCSSFSKDCQNPQLFLQQICRQIHKLATFLHEVLLPLRDRPTWYLKRLNHADPQLLLKRKSQIFALLLLFLYKITGHHWNNLGLWFLEDRRWEFVFFLHHCPDSKRSIDSHLEGKNRRFHLD